MIKRFYIHTVHKVRSTILDYKKIQYKTWQLR